jgi:hypothetical protein
MNPKINGGKTIDISGFIVLGVRKYTNVHIMIYNTGNFNIDAVSSL